MIIEFVKQTESLRKNGKHFMPRQRLVVDGEVGRRWIDEGNAKEVDALFKEIILVDEDKKTKKKK